MRLVNFDVLAYRECEELRFGQAQFPFMHHTILQGLRTTATSTATSSFGRR